MLKIRNLSLGFLETHNLLLQGLDLVPQLGLLRGRLGQLEGCRNEDRVSRLKMQTALRLVETRLYCVKLVLKSRVLDFPALLC